MSGINYQMGELTTGEPMPTPIIFQLKNMPPASADLSVYDSPPGASCAVVATIYDADYILLVTEATPFGLHDLQQMIGIIKEIDIPAGIIINRYGIGDEAIEKYITETKYPILMKIPYDKIIASGLAAGELFINLFDHFQEEFLELYRKIVNQLSADQDKNAKR